MHHFLVTGCDGYLGANLLRALADSHRVSGVGREKDAMVEAITRFRPETILHCGPASRGSWDRPARADELADERKLLPALIRAAQRSESHLVFVSSDVLFDGPGLFHDESALPVRRASGLAEIRRWERLALEAECLVVRTHAFGWGPADGEPSFAEVVWDYLRDGLPLPFYPDRAAAPILATDLAPLLAEAARRRLTGVYHLAGAERVTVGEFASRLADAFGWPAGDARFHGLPDRSLPKETALDSRRAARELRRQLPRLRDALARFAQQSQTGYRQRLRHYRTEREALSAA